MIIATNVNPVSSSKGYAFTTEATKLKTEQSSVYSYRVYVCVSEKQQPAITIAQQHQQHATRQPNLKSVPNLPAFETRNISFIKKEKRKKFEFSSIF